VLVVRALPEAGGAVPVRQRQELIGGKGANQAVACRQLGVAGVALVGVLGDDSAGDMAFLQARDDGIDVQGIARRPGTRTALLLDIVEDGGVRRLLEHVPDRVLLTPADVHAAAGIIADADTVLLQLQQPAAAVREVLRVAAEAGVPVVADGAPADEDLRREILAGSAVVRADEAETAALVGREVDGVEDAVAAAAELLEAGPRVVALAVGGEGNVVAWPGGHAVIPLLGEAPVDQTGGGDAFVATLAVVLARGADPETAAWWASAAAAQVVRQVGGRPTLDPATVEALAEQGRAEHR
jgi:ribokinase